MKNTLIITLILIGIFVAVTIDTNLSGNAVSERCAVNGGVYAGEVCELTLTD